MEKLADLIVLLLTKLIEMFSKKRTLQHVQNIVDIYVSLKKLVYGRLDDITPMPIYQCVIFKFEPDMSEGNRVKKFTPGTPYLVTCLYSDYRHPVDTFMRYKNLSCDSSVMDALLKVLQEKEYCITVKNLKRDSLLQLMLASEDIKYSEMHYLYEHKGEVYVALISTVNDSEQFNDPYIRREIELTVSNVARIIKSM